MRLTGREHLAAGLTAVAIAVTAVTGSAFWTYNMTVVAIFAIAAVGLNIVFGLAGQVSFAQPTFMAIGAYGTARLTVSGHLSPWAALASSAVFSALLATAIGLPLLRLRGHYLAMATFCLALGTQAFALGAVGLTAGATGIPGIPPLAIGGLSLGGPLAALLLAWGACALALAVFLLLSRSHIGRAWRAIAATEDVAAALGVPVRQSKLLAFVAAAVAASLAGSLYAEFVSFVSPDLFDISLIINLFLMVFIGGRGSVMGPVLGAAAVVLVPQAATGLGGWQDVVFFAALLGFMIFLPAGLMGIRGGRARPAPPPPAGGYRGAGVQASGQATGTAGPVGAVLAAQELTRRFGGVTAVQRASLSVGPAEIHGLIGPNGAGKSTMLALMSGFQRPDEGSITLLGRPCTRLRPAVAARSGLARTFQAATPLRGLSVTENLQVGLHRAYRSGVLAVLARTPRMRREARANQSRAVRLLTEYGLANDGARNAADLPFGKLRLLEVARAIAAGARIVLLDEPAAGLNRDETTMLASLIGKLREDGMSVLIVDHDVHFLFGLCDVITVMDFGRVIASGPPEAVAADPAVRAAYFGEPATAEGGRR